MQTKESIISYKIIQAHMQKSPIDLKSLLDDENIKYGLYDSTKNAIYTQIKEKIEFSKREYRTKNSIFYIGHDAFGHLDVSYVVIKKTGVDEKDSGLLKKIVFYATVAYGLIAFVGLYLAKLFIYPIQSQREKMNTFIKNATHELNTPISALLLCTDLDNFYNEKNRELIKISAKKISNLYKDITYITLAKHRLKTLCKIDISEILEKELIFHQSIAVKKKINLTIHIEKTLVKIDEEDFSRLVNNLISNAIKYTKRGGSVCISLKKGNLCIEDNGIGISKEKLSRIFERYYRGTDDIGGFGIGLDIVKSICKTYDIKIEITSKENRGTVCTLKFVSA